MAKKAAKKVATKKPAPKAGFGKVIIRCRCWRRRNDETRSRVAAL